MTPENIAKFPVKTITQEQRDAYFKDGYLMIEKAISEEWLKKLREAAEGFVERSRSVTVADKVFDIEPGHSAENPRLRRVSSPQDQHPVFWDLAMNSPLGDIVADLVGPDVKFHHSKLNFKWKKGGEEVKWHYDICSWPHTNYSPLTVGIYLYDCDMAQGPLGVIPKSHEMEMFNQYDENGKWVGYIPDADLAGLDLTTAKYMTGPAGSITIHNSRTVHGSPANQSDIGRPLLLYAFSSADAYPYTPNPIPSQYSGAIIRGQPAKFSHHDPRPCLMPPDWSGGYVSIFAVQQDKY